MGDRFVMSVLHVYNGGYWVNPIGKFAKLLCFFLEGVSFLGGPRGLYIMGGIFSAVRLLSDSPNFNNFFGRRFVFRGLCNLYKMEGIFHDPQHRQSCQALPFFLGRCSFAALRVTDI